MAACVTCGEKAGIGKVVCASCQAEHEKFEAEDRAARAREVQLQAQEQARRESEEREQRIAAFVDDCLSQMDRAHYLKLEPSLTMCKVVETTHSIHGNRAGRPPNLSALAGDLALGWEIMSIIPHTEGVGLINRMGNGNQIYAGGIGGLVTAVYVVLRLRVSPRLLELHRPYIEAVLRAQYEDGSSVISVGDEFTQEAGGSSTTSFSTMGQVAAGAAMGVVAGSIVSDLQGGGDLGADEGGDDFGDFDFE